MRILAPRLLMTNIILAGQRARVTLMPVPVLVVRKLGRPGSPVSRSIFAETRVPAHALLGGVGLYAWHGCAAHLCDAAAPANGQFLI